MSEERQLRSDLDFAHEAIQDLLQRQVEFRGGYPGFVCDPFRGWTFIVEEGDEGHKGPRLRFFRNRTILRWYRAAKRWQKENPEEDMVTALYENWPSEDQP